MEAVVFAGVKEVAKSSISVLFVYTTHYGSAKLYNAFCVPDGGYGYLQGLLTTASPWCKLTLETMRATENQYTSAVLLGVSRIVTGMLGF